MIWTEMLKTAYDGEKKEWKTEVIHYAGNHMDRSKDDPRFCEVHGKRKLVIPVGLLEATVEELLQ